MTQKVNNKLKYIQQAILIFIWVLLFSIPLLLGNNSNGLDWDHIGRIWKETAFLFVLFLVNHFFLVPFLFLKGKRVAYFIVTIVLIAMLAIGFLYLTPPKKPNSVYERYTFEHFDKAGMNGHQDMRKIAPPPHERPHPRPHQQGIPPYANYLILSILLLGFDMGLSVTIKWIESEQTRVQIEKENTQNQLFFLRNQVSPHFFMNTLNNIHALVDYNKVEAQSAIIKLSHMMGYMLYETEGRNVPFHKEILFVQNYIELMQLRFTDKVKIIFQIPETIPDVSIPPFLFISFIENAFKYGISYYYYSYVNIKFSFKEESLSFEIENSVHKKAEKKEKSGFGIENTRKRLNLIYGSKCKLEIHDEEKRFSVKLSLPL